jgi:hypothetical protein
MKKLTLATLTCLMFLSPNVVMSEEVKDEEILIVCKMGTGGAETYFVINKSRSIAKYMNLSENVVYGKLTITENSYVLHFPKTKTTYEALHRINRYSGEIEWEHGEPPFGEFNMLKNVFRSGVCSQGKNIKRF